MLRPWTFPEFEPVGVQLGTSEAVARFDRNQGTDAEADRDLLIRLGVTDDTEYVDLACGTGSMVVEAAAIGAHAHGVDVSEQMLRFAEQRAARRGVIVTLHRDGLLSYRHDRPADVITTKSALHQLPDFWKQVGLTSIGQYLRPGGLLYIWDLIFSFSAGEYESQIERLLDVHAAAAGDGFTREEFETHIREEYSTYSWILEGMLDRAGFDVVSTDYATPTHGEIVSVRR
jgi:putative AdoMet-dependent methyltransferase